MRLRTKDTLLVTIQFLLFILFGLNFRVLEITVPDLVKNIALFLAIFGIGMIMLAMLQLNKNLSPFPSPKADAQLIDTGIYQLIRHPIYTGILMAAFGYAIYSASGARIFLGLLLFILFLIKTRYEESQLQDRYPGYTSYKKRTGKFLPKFFRKPRGL